MTIVTQGGLCRTYGLGGFCVNCSCFSFYASPSVCLTLSLSLSISVSCTHAYLLPHGESNRLNIVHRYAGQGNYCAANAVLDHLAAFPTPEDPHSAVPMLTVNWGPWGEAGMAAPGTKAYVASYWKCWLFSLIVVTNDTPYLDHLCVHLSMVGHTHTHTHTHLHTLTHPCTQGKTYIHTYICTITLAFVRCIVFNRSLLC